MNTVTWTVFPVRSWSCVTATFSRDSTAIVGGATFFRLKALGGTVLYDYAKLPNSFAVKATTSALKTLFLDPAVSVASSDARVAEKSLTGSVTGTPSNSAYSLGAELGVPTFSCAAGTAVAVIDSGIANVPDFAGGCWRLEISRWGKPMGRCRHRSTRTGTAPTSRA